MVDMQRFYSLSALLIGLNLALGGCTHFQDRPINPTHSAVNLEARTLSNPALLAFIQSVAGKQAKTWAIDQLTLAAIYFHPDLAVARALVASAEAANITAAQRPNPSFTLSPTWISNLATGVAPWIVASSISIPIETAGKRDYRMAKTEHLTEAARLRVADTAWLVRGKLRLALLDVYAAEEAERLLQQQLTLQQEMTERLTQQFEAGEVSQLEVMRSQLALNQQQLNLSTARKRVAESRVMLATAIGMPVSALKGVMLDFSELSQPPALDRIKLNNSECPIGRCTAPLREVALRARPDVLAALADYAAAQSALQLEIANQYPNIQANPGYTWEMGQHRWLLGATALQLPVLHQNQGLIAEAEAKRRELAVRFEALQLRIMGDIDRAEAGVAAVMAKWSAVEQQKRLQQANLQTAQALLAAGETDRLALLLVELEGAITERARLDALVEAQQALNTLEDTLRSPLASTLTTTLISDSALRKSLP